MQLRPTRLVRVATAPASVLALAAFWTLLRGIDHRFISFSDGVYMYSASIAAAEGLHELYRGIALSLPPGTLIGATLGFRSGWRRALAIGAGAIGAAFALYLLAVWTFDWPAHQLVRQLLFAQAHSGFQCGLAGGIVGALLLMWWPLLLLVGPGWQETSTSTRYV